jgi:riboflavin kinase
MEIETLKRLAMIGSCREEIPLSVSALASLMGTSHQVAERELSLLEDLGYVERTEDSAGEKVRITESGRQQLPAEYRQHRCISESPRPLRGKVASGMGKGQYYLSREGYRRQFIAYLGFSPYPGTLNVKLQEPFDPSRQQAIKIHGFEDEGRAFGECRCYRIRINGIGAAIVQPERSNYPADLVEIIAPVNLRESLHLQDGDEVELERQ